MNGRIEQVKGWVRQVGAWANHAEPWQLFLAFIVGLLATQTVAALLLAPAVLLLLVTFGLAGFSFARAWLREFTFLMRVDDDAFHGRNDKLIWAILLIVVSPVGLYLFRSYRLIQWPEAKPISPAHDLF